MISVAYSTAADIVTDLMGKEQQFVCDVHANET